MKYLSKYEKFQQDLLLENLLSEKLDIKKIIGNAKNINIKSLIKKFKASNSKKIATIIAITLLSIYTGTQVSNYIENNFDNDEQLLLNAQLDLIQNSVETEKARLDSIETVYQDSVARYKKASEFTLTQEGWDHIRHEEGQIANKGEPVLTAYQIGDGMITIGYGHAEPSSTSQFKVGDKITKAKANELLIKDVNEKATGVRKIFTDWEDAGININITQNQFDVLVSIAYNKGVYGLRRSTFMQDLKVGDHTKAGETIAAESDKDFAGIAKRRKKEGEKFLL